MQTHIARWGNSLALRIPRHVADELALGEGRGVDLIVENASLVVRPLPTASDLDRLLAEITPENLPDDLPGDRPMGRERL
jgi:antitoxin MazE